VEQGGYGQVPTRARAVSEVAREFDSLLRGGSREVEAPEPDQRVRLRPERQGEHAEEPALSRDGHRTTGVWEAICEVPRREPHGRQKRRGDQSGRILELLAALDCLPHEPLGTSMVAGQLCRHPGQQGNAEAVQFIVWLDRAGAGANGNTLPRFASEGGCLSSLAQRVELE